MAVVARDSRTSAVPRHFMRNGVSWEVREIDASRVPGARAPTCLIFESRYVVRRVWRFPEGWRTLFDDALWAVTEIVPERGFQ